MDWEQRIESNKDVLLGKPVIKGTRISVEFILDRLAHGWSEEQLLQSYPHLEKKDLQAVFGYLNECVNDGLMREINRKTPQ